MPGGLGVTEMGSGVVNILGELVTNEDMERFTQNEGALLERVLDDLSIWFRDIVRTKCLGKASTGMLSSINKKAIVKELGRISAEDPRMSNKSCMDPQVQRKTTHLHQCDSSSVLSGVDDRVVRTQGLPREKQ